MFFVFILIEKTKLLIALQIYQEENKKEEKMSIDVFGYLYAATVATGGLIGYVKAGKYYIIK